MKRFYLIAILSLCACASEKAYVEYINSFIGYTKDDVLETFGLPDEDYKANGKEFLTYKQNLGNYVYVNQYGLGGTESYYCNTTYILEKGKVASFKYSGNACKR